VSKAQRLTEALAAAKKTVKGPRVIAAYDLLEYVFSRGILPLSRQRAAVKGLVPWLIEQLPATARNERKVLMAARDAYLTGGPPMKESESRVTREGVERLTAQKPFPKRKVSETALALRIHRKLLKRGERLRRCPRGSRSFRDFGRWYTVDLERNAPILSDVDLEKLGRKLGVLDLDEILKREAGA
jgi:hypothetical protein